MVLGAYEKWAFEALRRLSAGPWAVTDVQRLAVAVAADDVPGLRVERWCEVRDWLACLTGDDHVELVERLNEKAKAWCGRPPSESSTGSNSATTRVLVEPVDEVGATVVG